MKPKQDQPMQDNPIYGWVKIAKYLGCGQRYARYLEPILLQYGAIEYVHEIRNPFSGYRNLRIKGYPGLLDACRLDMASLRGGRIQAKWHGEAKALVTRYKFYVTQAMKDHGIVVPPEMSKELKPLRKEPYAKSKTPRRLHRRRDKTTVGEGGDGI